MNGQNFHDVSRKKAAEVLRSCDQLTVTMEISSIVSKLKPQAIVSPNTIMYSGWYASDACFLCLHRRAHTHTHTYTHTRTYARIHAHTHARTHTHTHTHTCTHTHTRTHRRSIFLVRRRLGSSMRRDCLFQKSRKEALLLTVCYREMKSFRSLSFPPLSFALPPFRPSFLPLLFVPPPLSFSLPPSRPPPSRPPSVAYCRYCMVVYLHWCPKIHKF